MTIELILGIAGMGALLLAFLMNQKGRWHRGSMIYDAVNVTGSGLLILYAISLAAWPFVALNTVWMVYSARDVILSLRKNR